MDIDENNEDVLPVEVQIHDNDDYDDDEGYHGQDQGAATEEEVQQTKFGKNQKTSQSLCQFCTYNHGDSTVLPFLGQKILFTLFPTTL